MGQLEDMALFIRVVEAGSITKAAEQLNLAKSAVSRRLKELEDSLDKQLITRTTRSSTITDAGQAYYQQSRQILADVSALNEQISGSKANVEGTLKMTAPLSFGLMHLSKIIHQYAVEHPNLTFKLDFSDRHVNLIEEGYELAFRIGELKDSSHQARRITNIHYALCASPEYLSQSGTPKKVADLHQHSFLQYGLNKHNEIVLTDEQGKHHSLAISSRIKANNGDFLVDMARRGHGIAYLPTFLTYQSIIRGELVRLLPKYQLPQTTAYAIYPKNKFLSQRCRLFIEFIKAQIGENPYWDEQLKQT